MGDTMWERARVRLRDEARRAGFGGAPTPVLVAGMALLCVAVVAELLRWWPQPANGAGAISHAARAASAVARDGRVAKGSESTPPSATVISPVSVVVYVVGAVERPGVYRLDKEARIEAAIDAAGGMKGDAAPEAVNLAAKATDGEQILVPTKAEFASGGALAVGGTSSSGGAAAGGDSAGGGKIDLNRADAAALDTLPGVGPSTAAKIVADRQTNGPYKSVDDLGRVPGIGPKKLEQLKPLVSVR